MLILNGIESSLLSILSMMNSNWLILNGIERLVYYWDKTLHRDMQLILNGIESYPTVSLHFHQYIMLILNGIESYQFRVIYIIKVC